MPECSPDNIVSATQAGIGKAALAVQLAWGAPGEGGVLLIDADREGSAQTALPIRAELDPR